MQSQEVTALLLKVQKIAREVVAPNVHLMGEEKSGQKKQYAHCKKRV
jgi:hypothetical protein